ncbi:hypothetical protein J7T55_015356 [Diaporthe amygdali]|uniref:uncharacterized protein n=1 Tax=Phomopsis amygdali TaxID=1214568 RepID=UPI0022FEBA94|nr:uncharacterized protein J7T55_015356 [Diaporthe amygdali]KAJ0120626.1 hypothetical protein J7T55_015356 [Diaporthe amygdali]
MANPNNYPAKPAAFDRLQRTIGHRFDVYRKFGEVDINMGSMASLLAIANRTQPVGGGIGSFQVRPPPGSAAAAEQLAAAIQNRGVGEQGMFSMDNPAPPQLNFASQNAAQAAVDAARLWMAANNFSFVKQLGWGADAVATLWYYSNPQGSTSNVVCKTRIFGPASLRELTNERRKLRNPRDWLGRRISFIESSYLKS